MALIIIGTIILFFVAVCLDINNWNKTRYTKKPGRYNNVNSMKKFANSHLSKRETKKKIRWSTSRVKEEPTHL